jgi:ferredoxin
MSEFIEERRVAGMLVRIDRTLCVAFETCIDIAPDVLRFDSSGVVTFVEADSAIDKDRLLEACRACPVDALSVFEDDGRQLVP